MKSSEYITKEYFEETLDKVLDKKLDEKLDAKLDEKFGEFAILMAKGFSDVYKKFDEQQEYMDKTFATKLDLYESEVRTNEKFRKIEDELYLINSHLGRMETRFSHLDEVVIKDHTPRIKNLELAVGV